MDLALCGQRLKSAELQGNDSQPACMLIVTSKYTRELILANPWSLDHDLTNSDLQSTWQMDVCYSNWTHNIIPSVVQI